MVSTPEIFAYNSTMPPGSSVTVIKTSARKSLFLFTEVWDVKKETDFRRVRSSKSDRKELEHAVCCGQIFQR